MQNWIRVRSEWPVRDVPVNNSNVRSNFQRLVFLNHVYCRNDLLWSILMIQIWMIWIKSYFERMMTRSTTFEYSILAFIDVDVIRILDFSWFLNIKVTCWSHGSTFFILSSDCILARITQSLKRVWKTHGKNTKVGGPLKLICYTKVDGRSIWLALALNWTVMDRPLIMDHYGRMEKVGHLNGPGWI